MLACEPATSSDHGHMSLLVTQHQRNRSQDYHPRDGDDALRSSAPISSARQGASSFACPMWKRVLDILGAIAGILVLSPLLLLIAGFVKCVSSGPVLFRQQRYGLHGRPFMVWKFRTM